MSDSIYVWVRRQRPRGRSKHAAPWRIFGPGAPAVMDRAALTTMREAMQTHAEDPRWEHAIMKLPVAAGTIIANTPPRARPADEEA